MSTSQNGTTMSIDPTIAKNIIANMNSVISAQHRGSIIKQQQYSIKTDSIILTLKRTVIRCRVNAIVLSQ